MSDALDFFTMATLRRYTRILLLIGKWLMRLLSASVEAFLRQNFGRRYLHMLAGAWLLFFVCAGLNRAAAPLSGLFLFSLFAFVVYHLVHAFRRRRLGIPEPHSSSAGTSLKYWQRFGLATTTVQRYLEPALCGMAGFVVAAADPFLGLWLKASAISLFIKELFNHLRVSRRITEALDAKHEAQRLNTGLNQYQSKAGQAAQKSHRARFPRHGQHPGP